MDLVRAAVLGVIQGLTEFLPISSEGHLVFIRHLLGWSDEGLAFDAVLHFGTFFAILIFFRRTWWRFVQVVLGRGTRQDGKLLGLIVLATIPAAVAGYFGQDLLKEILRGVAVAGGGFLFSAGVLFIADYASRLRKPLNSDPPVGLRQAITVGFFQILALLPGVSRLGSTITGGIVSGLSRKRALEFSFLISLPITGGAGLHALISDARGSEVSPLALILGFVLSLGAGIWAVRFLLNYYVRRHNFTPFVVYLVILAFLSFVLS